MAGQTTNQYISKGTMGFPELCKALGRSRPQMYPLAEQNRLPVPTLRIGERYKFSVHAVEEYLRTGEPSNPRYVDDRHEQAA